MYQLYTLYGGFSNNYPTPTLHTRYLAKHQAIRPCLHQYYQPPPLPYILVPPQLSWGEEIESILTAAELSLTHYRYFGVLLQNIVKTRKTYHTTTNKPH